MKQKPQAKLKLNAKADFNTSEETNTMICRTMLSNYMNMATYDSEDIHMHWRHI